MIVTLRIQCWSAEIKPGLKDYGASETQGKGIEFCPATTIECFNENIDTVIPAGLARDSLTTTLVRPFYLLSPGFIC